MVLTLQVDPSRPPAGSGTASVCTLYPALLSWYSSNARLLHSLEACEPGCVMLCRVLQAKTKQQNNVITLHKYITNIARTLHCKNQIKLLKTHFLKCILINPNPLGILARNLLEPSNPLGILARNLPESSQIIQCTFGNMPLSSKCTMHFRWSFRFSTYDQYFLPGSNLAPFEEVKVPLPVSNSAEFFPQKKILEDLGWLG